MTRDPSDPPEAWELPPDRPPALAVMVVDCIVWALCAAFVGAVAFSYLLAVTP
jgi:hypothetical protein